MKKEIKNKKPGGMGRRNFLKGMALGAGAALVLPARVSAQSGVKPVQNDSAEKIDLFCHVLPKKYKEELFQKSRPCCYLEADKNKPALFDLDMRCRDLSWRVLFPAGSWTSIRISHSWPTVAEPWFPSSRNAFRGRPLPERS